jgi:hypothetical protein
VPVAAQWLVVSGCGVSPPEERPQRAVLPGKPANLQTCNLALIRRCRTKATELDMWAFVEDLRHTVLKGGVVHVIRETKGVYKAMGSFSCGKKWTGKLLQFRPMSDAGPGTYTFDSGDYHQHNGLREARGAK